MIALGISAYSFANFNENPIVTIISGIAFLSFALIIGNREFILYEDRARYSSDSLLSLLRHQPDTFILDQIGNIQVSGNFGLNQDLITDVSSIELYQSWNSISFTLKDGSKKEFNTKIYINDLKKLESLVRKVIREQK